MNEGNSNWKRMKVQKVIKWILPTKGQAVFLGIFGGLSGYLIWLIQKVFNLSFKITLGLMFVYILITFPFVKPILESLEKNNQSEK